MSNPTDQLLEFLLLFERDLARLADDQNRVLTGQCADEIRKMQRVQLKGELTSPINPKPGCRFAARCPYATAKCQEPQQLREIESGHFVQCCRIEEID